MNWNQIRRFWLGKTYKESTKYTLEHAEIITKELETELEIHLNFSTKHHFSQ